MQIRPFIEMRVGQINLPLRIPISPLLVDAPTTILTGDTPAGSGTLTVANTSLFHNVYSILIGEPGNQNSEIIQIDTITDINTIELDSNTNFPHSASTNIYLLRYNQVEIYNASTVIDDKDLLVTLPMTADVTTDYYDQDSEGGYYFARFTQAGIGQVTQVSIDAVENFDYQIGDVLTLVSGNNNCTVTVTEVDGDGALVSVSLTTEGNGYQVGSGIVGSGGNGAGATFSVNSIQNISPYSDDAPYEGYTLQSARYVINSALDEINKTESQTLTDEFAFQQLDNVQMEVIQLLKRWSFMQKFDITVGHAAQGSWKFTLPEDIGNDKSNKSVYQLRVGTQQRLVWVDKQKFDEFLVGVAYSTLAANANMGDTTLTLVDSSSFNSLASQTQDGSGSVTIGANTYAYSANDTETGILTLEDALTADNTAAIGADVFQGATQGLPNYWTTYGGLAYYWPITSQSYNGFQLLMDYYSKQLKITSDSDLLVFPDTTVAIYYLCWKMLKKLNNGSENESSLAYKSQYEAQKEKMRVKEVMNRTFKFRPRIQNFATQSAFSESTPRWVRDAEFPNTGF